MNDEYPNDGTFFVHREPAEQEIARKKERAQTLEALPKLKVIAEHLETRVKFYEAVDSIPKEVRKDPAQFLIAYNANLQTRDNLLDELGYVQNLINSNARNL